MGKTALVTGASAGLGTEFARLFARDGHDVVLVARRRDRLDALAAELQGAHGVKVHAMVEDLADERAPERIAGELARRGAEVEFLVNNAGFGASGRFADMPPARALEMVHVNVSAVVALTRELLPAMIARRSGRVLNVGSTAGFEPGPYMAVYYASKAFVNSFTEALAFELRGTGVTATVCCPGPTHTEFASVAGNGQSRLFRMAAMDAAGVAASGYRAMMRGQAMTLPGLLNKFALQTLRVAPRRTVRAITAALNRAPDGDA